MSEIVKSLSKSGTQLSILLLVKLTLIYWQPFSNSYFLQSEGDKDNIAENVTRNLDLFKLPFQDQLWSRFASILPVVGAECACTEKGDEW